MWLRSTHSCETILLCDSEGVKWLIDTMDMNRSLNLETGPEGIDNALYAYDSEYAECNLPPHLEAIDVYEK